MPIISGGGGGGGAAGAVLATTLHLSAADILALNVTPAVLVPAAVGIAPIPIFVFYEYHPGATQYTVAPGTHIEFGGSDMNETWITFSDTFTLASATESFNSGPNPGQLAGANTDIFGLGLAVWLDAAVTDGDGTLTVSAYYVAQTA